MRHTTRECRLLLLDDMGHLIHGVLLGVPLLSIRLILVTVLELSRVRSAQEVRDRVSVLNLNSSERKNAVQGRLEALAREEAKSVADVDDDLIGARLDVLPGTVGRGEDLKSPLRRIEDRQRSDVRVHVLADLVGVLGARGVVQKVQGALGAAVVAVVSLEASIALEVEAVGETVEEELGDEVAR